MNIWFYVTKNDDQWHIYIPANSLKQINTDAVNFQLFQPETSYYELEADDDILAQSNYEQLVAKLKEAYTFDKALGRYYKRPKLTTTVETPQDFPAWLEADTPILYKYDTDAYEVYSAAEWAFSPVSFTANANTGGMQLNINPYSDRNFDWLLTQAREHFRMIPGRAKTIQPYLKGPVVPSCRVPPFLQVVHSLLLPPWYYFPVNKVLKESIILLALLALNVVWNMFLDHPSGPNALLAIATKLDALMAQATTVDESSKTLLTSINATNVIITNITDTIRNITLTLLPKQSNQQVNCWANNRSVGFAQVDAQSWSVLLKDVKTLTCSMPMQQQRYVFQLLPLLFKVTSFAVLSTIGIMGFIVIANIMLTKLQQYLFVVKGFLAGLKRRSFIGGVLLGASLLMLNLLLLLPESIEPSILINDSKKIFSGAAFVKQQQTVGAYVVNPYVDQLLAADGCFMLTAGLRYGYIENKVPYQYVRYALMITLAFIWSALANASHADVWLNLRGDQWFQLIFAAIIGCIGVALFGEGFYPQRTLLVDPKKRGEVAALSANGMIIFSSSNGCFQYKLVKTAQRQGNPQAVSLTHNWQNFSGELIPTPPARGDGETPQSQIWDDNIPMGNTPRNGDYGSFNNG